MPPSKIQNKAVSKHFESYSAGPAHAVSTKASGSGTTATGSTTTCAKAIAQVAADQARLQLIISRGIWKLSDVSATLNTLDSKISSATNRSASEVSDINEHR